MSVEIVTDETLAQETYVWRRRCAGHYDLYGGWLAPVVRTLEIPSVGQTVPVLTLSRAKLIDSTSDPAWRLAKTKLISYPRRRINLREYLRIPVKPVAYYPRREPRYKRPVLLDVSRKLIWIKPQRKDGWSNSYYEVILRRSEARYVRQLSVARKRAELRYKNALFDWQMLKNRCEERYQAYLLTFARRMKKYERRMAVYKRRLEVVKNWQNRGRLGFGRPCGLLPDHPYQFEQIIALSGNRISLRRFAYESRDDPWDWYYGMNAEENLAYWGVQPPLNNIGYFASDNLWPDTNNPITTGESFVSTVVTSIDEILHDEITELDLKLRNKLESKVRKGDFHLANFIAERAQTMSMLAEALKRLTAFVKRKKHFLLNAYKYAKHPRSLANDFLAFKFGVEPLLSDVKSAAELLAEQMLSGDDDTLAFRVNNTTFFSKDHTDLTGTWNYSGKLEISYVVKYSISESWSRLLSRLGMINPLEPAWELMPWSFVIDWFVPVSRFLEGATSEVGLSFKTGTRKIRLDYTRTRAKSTPTTPITDGIIYFSSSGPRVLVEGEYAHKSKRRTVLTGLPESDFSSIKNPFSWTHNLEALALTVQKLFK